MKKVSKKAFALLLCSTMTASLAGCGGGNSAPAADNAPSAPAADTEAAPEESNTEDSGNTEAAAPSAELSGALDIWAWGADDEAKSREGAIEIFVAEHPELDITYTIIPTADSVWDQKAAAALSSGSAGDVMQMSPDYYGMNTEYYIDLNPYVEAEGVNLDDVLVPGMIDGYYDTDGKLEGFPNHANCFVMAYNKDMFEAAGVPVPEAGWTLKDLADWGQSFAGGEGANQTYGLAKHWVMNNMMPFACGGVPYTDDLSTSKMGEPEIVDSLTLYKELIDKGIIPNDTALETIPAETLFVSGKSAMYPCGGFETITVTNDADENGINIGFCPMPSSTNGDEINVQYATGWAVTTTSKNPDAGWQFLKEIAYANDEMAKQIAICGMPANEKIAEDYYKNITFKGEGLDNSYYVEHMGSTQINPFGGTLASSGNIWTSMIEAVLLDNQDPQAVVDQYAPQIEAEFSGYSFNN